MDKTRYCWSSNGEYYNGSFDTEQEAIEDAKATVNDVCEEIYVGTCKEPILSWNSQRSCVPEKVRTECLDWHSEMRERKKMMLFCAGLFPVKSSLSRN